MPPRSRIRASHWTLALHDIAWCWTSHAREQWTLLTDLEILAGRPGLAKCYQKDADRIEAAYFKSFYNLETGVLAGWRTEGRKLQDFMFPWVEGFAICQGLVPPEKAKVILHVLLTKLETIGFNFYTLGLSTNLTPMSPADYVPHTSVNFGLQTLTVQSKGKILKVHNLVLKRVIKTTYTSARN